MKQPRAIGLASAFAGLAAFLLTLVLAGPSSAQTLSNTFGGLSESSDQPIDIESDILTVYDAKKYATFKGNVKAVQGTTTLRAAELDVHYVGGTEKLTGQEAAPVAAKDGAEDNPEAQINKIEARGKVVITSEDDQTTTSDWALYDVPAQTVTVGGNVVLTQGQNVLKGDRLVIDLKTGESRFENTGNAAAGGRIRALFMPKSAEGDEAADGKRKKKRDGAADGEDPDPAASAEAGQGEPTPANDADVPGVDDGEPLPLMPEFR
ncbi:MAG: LptA/OstA family protein [Methyloceanibacter sp.]|uniref:LptA/OstA family protein n=1 Tax=Methyloceanibacter sp. TaxID=1965321 RepID=UPI003D6CE3E6